jgi:enamine deaminase RidA (YjgF/YER057c/UK114 family)
MDIVKLVEGYIESKKGGAVSQQFTDSWKDSDFESQNRNALKHIKECVEDIIESDLLNVDVIVELEDYLGDLITFLEN